MNDNEIKRNCSSCKLSFLNRCETLKVELYKNGYNDKNGSKKNWEIEYKIKENFICDSYKCKYIEYPIEVSKINTDNNKGGYRSQQIGKFAKICPCGEEYKGKTYLGLFLGELPISNHISYMEDSKELSVSFHNNPAIFVFDLNKIIYGCESWWGIIENEEDLKEIANDDIDNIWYMKLLKALGGQDEIRI